MVDLAFCSLDTAADVELVNNLLSRILDDRTIGPGIAVYAIKCANHWIEHLKGIVSRPVLIRLAIWGVQLSAKHESSHSHLYPSLRNLGLAIPLCFDHYFGAENYSLLLAVQSIDIPSPISREWLFNSSSYILFNSRVPSQLIFDGHLTILDECIGHIRRQLARDDYEDFIRSILSFLISAKTKELSRRAYSTFKRLMLKFSPSCQNIIIADMMTCYPKQIATAGIDLLKSKIYKDQEKLFGIDMLQKTFFPILFDLTSPLYRNNAISARSDISHAPLFFDRFEILMDALNLCYFFLRRYSDLMDLNHMMQKFVDPVRKACTNIDEKINDENSSLCMEMLRETNLDHVKASRLSLQMMDIAMARVLEELQSN